MKISMKTYIARDNSGQLYMYFGAKPFKGSGYWYAESMGGVVYLKNDLFPEVKWENEEPTEVEIKIVDSSQKQAQTKFDPKALKPFDKVLVLNDNDTWQVEFFSHICQHEPNGWCQCSGDSYYFCIPYNDETKHLVGTTEEAPEFYRYWED